MLSEMNLVQGLCAAVEPIALHIELLYLRFESINSLLYRATFPAFLCGCL